MKSYKVKMSSAARKKLKRSWDWDGHWRYRVGDYRIIAKIEDDKVIIFVVKIDKRGEVYS